MKLTDISAFLSTALAIYSCIPYFIAIVKGTTKPHQLSWVVFTIMNGIVFFSQYFSGGRGSVLISFIFFIGSFIILLLSLKYGMRESSKWDRFLFIFALITIAIWYMTKSNDVAIWLTVVIDIAATTMMILKIKAMPFSEDPFAWNIATLAYVFTCLTLVGQPLSILYVRPWYGLIGDVALIAVIYYYRLKARKKITTTPMEL